MRERKMHDEPNKVNPLSSGLLTCLLVVFFLSIASNLFGQLQLPFPDDANIEATWKQHRYKPPDPADPYIVIADYYYSYYNQGTDSIEGELYHRLFSDQNAWEIAHYRVDSLKVYYRSDYALEATSYDQHGFDIPGGGEYVLYDYGLAVGDTFYFPLWGAHMVLNHFDSVQVDGLYYKTFHFDYNNNFYFPLEYYWIEGIGSSIGFYPYFDYFEDQLYFHCFFENNIEYYANGIDCNAAEIDLKEEPEFSIYPNPAINVINIETVEGEPFDGELSNLSGQVVMKFSSIGNHYSMDVESLKQGIYFIKLNNSSYKIVIE